MNNTHEKNILQLVGKQSYNACQYWSIKEIEQYIKMLEFDRMSTNARIDGARKALQEKQRKNE